jgi:hypothetical protein
MIDATNHDWGFAAEPDQLGRSVPPPRGCPIGGWSAANACFRCGGWPQDYDRRAAAGNPGWPFFELLPVFRAIESDADFGGRWHGSDGLAPIRRPSAGELSPLQRFRRRRCRRWLPAGPRPQQARRGGGSARRLATYATVCGGWSLLRFRTFSTSRTQVLCPAFTRRERPGDAPSAATPTAPVLESGSNPMATLQIEHPITDFGTWKAAFDRFAEARANSGVRGHRILRPVDDAHYVVIDLDFQTVARQRSSWASCRHGCGPHRRAPQPSPAPRRPGSSNSLTRPRHPLQGQATIDESPIAQCDTTAGPGPRSCRSSGLCLATCPCPRSDAGLGGSGSSLVVCGWCRTASKAASCPAGPRQNPVTGPVTSERGLQQRPDVAGAGRMTRAPRVKWPTAARALLTVHLGRGRRW